MGVRRFASICIAALLSVPAVALADSPPAKTGVVRRHGDCGRAYADVETWRNGKRHGTHIERECERGVVKIVLRGRYCRDIRCGVWTRRVLGTKARERWVYGKHGGMIAKTVWDERGRVVEHWSLAAQRRAAHKACLRELARGGCCDPEQNPPKGAKMCINGQKSRHRRHSPSAGGQSH